MEKRLFTRWLRPDSASQPLPPLSRDLDQILREDGRRWRQQTAGRPAPELLQHWRAQLRQVSLNSPDFRSRRTSGRPGSGSSPGRSWRPVLAVFAAGLLLLTAAWWQYQVSRNQGSDPAALSLRINQTDSTADNLAARTEAGSLAGAGTADNQERSLLQAPGSAGAEMDGTTEAAESGLSDPAGQLWELTWSATASPTSWPVLRFQQQTDQSSLSDQAEFSIDLAQTPDLSTAELTVWLTGQAVAPQVSARQPSWTVQPDTTAVAAPLALSDAQGSWDPSLLFSSSVSTASSGEAVVWSGLAGSLSQLETAIAQADPDRLQNVVLLIRLQEQFLVLPLQFS
ncbi:hypothetical protein HCH52_08110 [Oscillospiraceae bacterium HV4-5-C5C]|nr:hypothetical protein [Oscillospiraceae bacterium HV4-5-C5C]